MSNGSRLPATGIKGNDNIKKGDSRSIRIVSWNILQGGGRRLARICEALTQWSPDIVVLQEVRRGGVAPLTDCLSKLGLNHSFYPDTESARENSLYLASKAPLDAGEFLEQPTALCHILEAETMGMTLLPVHFPQKAAQVPLFEALLTDSSSLLAQPSLIIGDLNCGLPFQDSSQKTFVNARYFQALKDVGWIDIYRQTHGQKAQDFTWVSPRTQRGFRYDHALASPSIAQRNLAMTYDHTVREQRLSDHSALLFDLNLGEP